MLKPNKLIMINDIIFFIFGVLGIISMWIFIGQASKVGEIKNVLKTKTIKCKHCDYTFIAFNYYSPFCPRCNKDAEGKKTEDYQ